MKVLSVPGPTHASAGNQQKPPRSVPQGKLLAAGSALSLLMQGLHMCVMPIVVRLLLRMLYRKEHSGWCGRIFDWTGSYRYVELQLTTGRKAAYREPSGLLQPVHLTQGPLLGVQPIQGPPITIILCHMRCDQIWDRVGHLPDRKKGSFKLVRGCGSRPSQ